MQIRIQMQGEAGCALKTQLLNNQIQISIQIQIQIQI